MRATSEFSETGSVDAFVAIVESIRAMTASVQGSSVVVNAQTGSVVVTSSKETQAQIRDYLSQENGRLRQMVNVTMDIYTIKKSDSDEQSINWSVVYKALAGNINATLSSAAGISAPGRGGMTITKIKGEYDGSTLVLNALRATGNTVAHRPISMTTLNGKLRSQTGTNTVAYVKETTPGLASASGAAGAPGLKTDTIVTGDMFSVLPVIQPDNSVIVKYTVSLSSLVGITNFTSGTGASAQSVQIPSTDSISDSADLRIAPGESYLITGLSRLMATDDNSRLTEGASIAFGGANKKSVAREHFVVLVRATPI
jgi:type IVB pilus formation R64 PilN family outer membrane protein